MSSKRIYITLNDAKEKDKAIINLLSSAYSEKDMIKEILYQYAVNRDSQIIKKSIKKDNTEKVQTAPIHTQKVLKDSDKKVSKGTNSNKTVQNDTLKQNELKDLKKFIL